MSPIGFFFHLKQELPKRQSEKQPYVEVTYHDLSRSKQKQQGIRL